MRIAVVSDIHGNLPALLAVVADLISVPYAYQEMAELARLRNRPDWVCALLTGYMA